MIKVKAQMLAMHNSENIHSYSEEIVNKYFELKWIYSHH